MINISEAQQVEIAQLKSLAEQARSGAKRARFPQSFRDRVCALHEAGLPLKKLCAELQLAYSSTCQWRTIGLTRRDQPPQVLAVEPPSDDGAAAPLTLSCGAFIITVRVA